MRLIWGKHYRNDENLSHEHNCMNKWQSLLPDFNWSVMSLMVLRIIGLPPDLRNFKAQYFSNSTFFTSILLNFLRAI